MKRASQSIRSHAKEEVLAPDNVPYQMFILVQQMTKRFQAVLSPHRITPLHWGVLSCLWKEDGLRTTEIAQRLEQLGGTITVGLDSMQRRGLIRRQRSAVDGRVSQILLTEKGRRLRAVLEPAAATLVTEIFAALSAEDYTEFARQIRVLRTHLGRVID